MARHPNQTNGYNVGRSAGTQKNPTMPGESTRQRDLAQLAMVQASRPLKPPGLPVKR